jgi:hypothetical protein
MTGMIFLSYRRKGAAEGFAHALFNRLEQAFPPENLFMDVEGGIGAGHDFVQVLEQEVSACDAMLVLIGPDWLTLTDEQGRQRLENPEDFVRIEVESALRLGKRVIPVLLQKTEMPRADALPEPLKALARRNAFGLAQGRFGADAQGLVKELEGALAEAEAAKRQAATDAAAAEKRRAAAEAAKAEEAARAEKERARLKAIAGLSPEQIGKAEELANWDFIKASESIEDFRDHLARFQQGTTERMAWTRLEALVWAGLPQQANAEALKRFLAEFPKGAHASEATAKFGELESQAAAGREAAEREKREMTAWASASGRGTVAALEDFQKDWPRSKYADAARKRISEIKEAPSRRRLLQGVGRRLLQWIGLGACAAALVGLVLLLNDPSSRTFSGHAGEVNSVAFSPDGRTALSGSYGTLKLWDVATGKEIRSFAGHTGPVFSVAFSPDGGTALSGSDDKTLKLWDIATGKEIRSFAGHTDSIHSVTFSPDGRSALSGSKDETLKLWDIATGREIRSFTAHAGLINSVAFSPDGRRALSGSDDKTLKLWDLATGKAIRTFTGHTDSIHSVAFSPDDRLALSGSNDETLKLWDVATGKAIRTFTAHYSTVNHPVFSVAFSRDGRSALSGSWDETLRLWDLTGRQ